MIDYTLKKSEDLTTCFANLYEIMTLLRSPEGCPWDRKQTCKDTIRSLMGECYEYIDALGDNDNNEAKEELGDIYLNLFLLTRIHEENGDFLPSDAINSVCEKLIRRHPHVFSTVTGMENSDNVVALWDKIKTDVEGRKADNENIFSKIPKSQPELETSYDIQKKVSKLGFDWTDANEVYQKVEEELAEVKNAKTEEERQMEIGDLLFSVVNLARLLKIKPQEALHASNDKFKKRFNTIIEIANKEQIEINTENLNKLWDKVKETE